MIFSLDILRARKGDCLLLHFGSKKEPGLVLIDGGPGDVYKPHLRPRLEAVRAARKLGAEDPLSLDVLLVSHVDDDHIHGILDLTAEMLKAKQRQAPPLVQASSFWHNSFEDIIGGPPNALTEKVTAQFGAASTSGELPPDAWVDSNEDDVVVRSSLKVLASIAQGARLRGDAEKLGYPRNPQHKGKLIMAAQKQVAVAEGLTFHVAGPMQPELLALQKEHQEWLRTQKDAKAEEALSAYVDKSVPNLSSIVLLAECGGKKMLLTGDARGDKILEGLESTRVIQPGASLTVDILKVPHHGSANNVEAAFFERIKATHYVFSGDGEHGNPERETMEMLFDARGGEPFTVHLTYPIDQLDAARKSDWEKEQNKEKARRKAGSRKPVRENWSATKHGLAAFFESRRLSPGQKVIINEDSKTHAIDLLDRLG